MALNLSKNSMILTSNLTKQLDLEWENILIIQHWVQDAIDFWLKLKDNSNANVLFLPKPYSQNENALKNGIKNWLDIKNPWYNYEEWLEKEWYIEDILEQYRNKSLLIIEVWWIIAEKIIKKWKNIDFVKWIVEVTTFWHNRHIEAWTNITIPTFSVARSPIKQEESRHVWYAVYASLHKVLNELDRSVNDCKISMVWYWMIWENVCNAMKLCREVNIFDVDMQKVLKANEDWFYSSINYTELVKDSDVVIASTGKRSINSDFISACRDWVLLVSAWSRQNEIDVEFLEKNTEELVIKVHEFISRYVIDNKEIFLFREWKNANFAFKSCPAFSMDLLHAEILTCVNNILKWKYIIWRKELNEVSKKERDNLIDEHKKIWD
jgi:adenosylhomocysteinase